MQSEQPSTNPPTKSPTQPPPKGKRRRNMIVSVVLPLILFVLLIGGIAWIAQNVSHRRDPATAPPAKSKPALVFQTQESGPEEHVVGSEGHFDFPFSNGDDKPIKVGVSYVSCQCSSAKIAVFAANEPASVGNAKWKDVKPYEPGLKVPPKGKGILRIEWHDREKLPKAQTLMVKTWYQDLQSGDAFETQVAAKLRLVSPIRCLPLRMNIGAISDRGDIEAAFWCWSPFYEKLDIDVLDDNPLFEYTITPLDKSKRDDLVKKLEKLKDSTTIKSAMRVAIRVHAKKGDKHLDLGPFARQIILQANGKTFETAGPLLVGRVQGPLTVGRKSDKGRIQLPTFLVDAGITQRVRITGPKSMKLSVDKVVPSNLFDVKLAKDDGASNPRSVWYLTVTVPPGKASLGHMPDDCAVFLQTGSSPPRLIRIPVQGYAKRR